MLYIIIIIASIIIGLLRGGELERLANNSINGIYLFVIALLLRILVWAFGLLGFSFHLIYTPFLIIISYLLLIFVAWHNIKLPGFRYIILGLLLNAFVIIVNGGKMPVLIKKGIVENYNASRFIETQTRTIHSLMNNNTLFAFLGDVIAIPKPFPDTSIISVGDIMIFIGLFVLIQKTMMSEDHMPPEEENIE